MAAVRLFVGGLAFTTSTDGLRAAFARFGPVQSAAVMTDRETGRSRGFGFVEMASEEEAEKAISGLNGSSLDGRMIRVDRATPRGAGGPPARPVPAVPAPIGRAAGAMRPGQPVRVTASDRAAAGAASLRGQAAAGPRGRAAVGRPRCPRDGPAAAGAAAVAGAVAIGGRASRAAVSSVDRVTRSPGASQPHPAKKSAAGAGGSAPTATTAGDAEGSDSRQAFARAAAARDARTSP